MTTTTTPAPPQPILRADYREPEFWIDETRLHFELGEDETLVHSRLVLRRNASGTAGAPLVLAGAELATRRVVVDGRQLGATEYEVTEDELTIEGLGDAAVLELTVAIRPQDNTALSGLYKSSGNFCTQCEAQGFRRITWYLDRPDVMAAFHVTIDADPERYPVLLSNGNRVAQETLADGRKRVCWEDPFKKPAYLFALVAGDLSCHAGSFTTASGRDIALEIWVEPQNIDKCEHALESLKKSMRWDEETYGLEYDLDIYMIVAVGDFNMGAMENKGLNVFNSKFVLASPETATDGDYEGIEGVIAHEYFHNWTGNRVTCRDWFQLTLKEGLTVYRDQRFSQDMISEGVVRIDGVAGLRSHQFIEDSGPMAHPIRPESYIEMNNFYTSTVYQKGAEVIRMYEALLGRDGFRAGMDLYFERHDGQAVTCDDFRAAMADANHRDLSQFERWYTQPGTPVLEVKARHDAEQGTYALTFRQSRPPVAGSTEFLPMHLPVRMALLGSDGAPLTLHPASEEYPDGVTEIVLELFEEETTITFTGIEARPVPSLLRGFSAPVKLRVDEPRADLAFRMAHDGDDFNRWEAGQALMKAALVDLVIDVQAGAELELDPLLVEAYARLLVSDLDPALKAVAMGLPGHSVLAQEFDVIDPDAIRTALRFAQRTLALANREVLVGLVDANAVPGPYRYEKGDMAKRRLASSAQGLLSCLAEEDAAEAARLRARYDGGTSMSVTMPALAMIAGRDVPYRREVLDGFYAKWKDDPLVLDKWFMVQAMTGVDTAVEEVAALVTHADYNPRNPNRVRSLVGAFAGGNPVAFHRKDGAGYRFVADRVIEMDALNPQVASRLVGSFNTWKRYDEGRQALMRAELERILAVEGLSKDVYEIVSKALK